VVLQPLVHIDLNQLLHDDEKTLSLAEAQLVRQMAVVAGQNLGSVEESVLGDVDAAYGGGGLFQLVGMAMAHDEGEFKHFFEVMSGWLAMRSVLGWDKPRALDPDNARLRQSKEGARLALNVLQPSLSRKLYRAGRHHGSLVYGLGGARILVSHPFRGRVGDIYDVYNNSLDVVTSLQMRGFDGAFHFLDYLPGLETKVNGLPGWLAWFAIIAAHSDLVVFIRDPEGGFRTAQQQEIEFTPDRVHKKIVDVPRSELTWAKKTTDVEGLPRMYIGQGRMMTEDEWFAMETEHAMPLIEGYTDGSFPQDRLVVIHESGDVSQYPLDYPVYEMA
jgi:hypothetical protein